MVSSRSAAADDGWLYPSCCLTDLNLNTMSSIVGSGCAICNRFSVVIFKLQGNGLRVQLSLSHPF